MHQEVVPGAVRAPLAAELVLGSFGLHQGRNVRVIMQAEVLKMHI